MIAHPAQMDAERAATRLLELVVRRGGARSFQGARIPAFSCAADAPTVRRFATERFYRVPALAAEALVRWAEGQPVELWTTVPKASDVLRLQAGGARCVSVLDESSEPDPLDFLLHDLCHLGKFACSEHFAEQVGFFRTLHRAVETPAWRSIEADLDDEFRRDFDHVASDMNGSAVFLFAAFKMKLKMAARRLAARRTHGIAPTSGALAGTELGVFRELFAKVLDIFGFDGVLRDAAVGTSTRRDSPELATVLVEHFRREGT